MANKKPQIASLAQANPDLVALFLEATKGLPVMDINRVEPDPLNVREEYDDEKMEALVQSIRDRLQNVDDDGQPRPLPPLVSPIGLRSIEGDRYMTTSGHRRLRAHLMLGLPGIQYVHSAASSAAAVVTEQAIENLMRSDLTPWEEANLYARLMEVHRGDRAKVAALVHKAPNTIKNRMAILDFPPEIGRLVDRNGFSNAHAKALGPFAQKRPDLVPDALRALGVGSKQGVCDAHDTTSNLADWLTEKGHYVNPSSALGNHVYSLPDLPAKLKRFDPLALDFHGRTVRLVPSEHAEAFQEAAKTWVEPLESKEARARKKEKAASQKARDETRKANDLNKRAWDMARAAYLEGAGKLAKDGAAYRDLQLLAASARFDEGDVALALLACGRIKDWTPEDNLPTDAADLVQRIADDLGELPAEAPAWFLDLGKGAEQFRHALVFNARFNDHHWPFPNGLLAAVTGKDMEAWRGAAMMAPPEEA